MEKKAMKWQWFSQTQDLHFPFLSSPTYKFGPFPHCFSYLIKGLLINIKFKESQSSLYPIIGFSVLYSLVALCKYISVVWHQMRISDWQFLLQNYFEGAIDEENVILTLVPVNEEIIEDHQMEPGVSSALEVKSTNDEGMKVTGWLSLLLLQL